MNEFDRYVAGFPPTKPLLPLFHVCDAVGFKHIIQDLQIRAFECDVFQKTELAYFFYGRPSYRVKGPDAPTSSSVFFPVCFVLDFEKIGLPHHVFPFDSGAQHFGLFKDFLHKSWTHRDFQLSPGIETPARLINCFYGNNANYVSENVVQRQFAPLDLELNAYQNLIANKGTTPYDNRRSTVEVAYKGHISISPENLITIILPVGFQADPRVQEFRNKTNIDFLTYNPTHTSPSEYHAAIKMRVDDLLTQNNYL